MKFHRTFRKVLAGAVGLAISGATLIGAAPATSASTFSFPIADLDVVRATVDWSSTTGIYHTVKYNKNEMLCAEVWNHGPVWSTPTEALFTTRGPVATTLRLTAPIPAIQPGHYALACTGAFRMPDINYPTLCRVAPKPYPWDIAVTVDPDHKNLDGNRTNNVTFSEDFRVDDGLDSPCFPRQTYTVTGTVRRVPVS